MAFDGVPTYAFDAEAVRDGAPEESGVYAIFTPTRWVFIGDSDNVRAALFQHLNTPNLCIYKYHPLSFSCELASRSERAGLREALLAELRPACHAVTGSPR